MQLPINALLLGLGEVARAQAFLSFRLRWKAKKPGKLIVTLVVDAPQPCVGPSVVAVMPARANNFDSVRRGGASDVVRQA
jgi:hypothetical protein